MTDTLSTEHPGTQELPPRVGVAFEGARAGRAPLTWGQRAILLPLLWWGPETTWFNIVRAIDLPAGPAGERLGLEEVLDVVRGLLRDFETLRTRVVPMAPDELRRCHGDDDRDCLRPHVAQEAVATGELDVVVERCGTDGDVPAVARELLDRFAGRSFDLEHDLPLRAGVVLVDDVPRVLTLSLSHLAVDGSGYAVLAEELLARLEEVLEATRGVPAAARRRADPLQPFDLAALEESPDWQARDERAQRFWRERARRMVGYPALAPKVTRDGRWQTVGLHSRASALAARLLASRYGISDSALLLAAASLGLHRAGLDRTYNWKAVTGNRFIRAFEAFVGVVGQDCLVVVPVEGEDLATVAGATATEMLRASRHSRFDPFAMAEAVRAEERRRGECLDFGLVFNDVRTTGVAPAGPAGADLPGVDDVRAALAASVVRGGQPQQLCDWTVFYRVSHEGDGLLHELVIDTEEISAEDGTRALEHLDAILVGAVEALSV